MCPIEWEVWVTAISDGAAVRIRTFLLLAFAANAALPAFAQAPNAVSPDWVPPGANPETGARPGNIIGTGMSLPTSNKASNITAQDTTSPIAPRLPNPPVPEGGTSHAFLVAARAALVGDRTGEAQEALEWAETRALDRSVPLFQTSTPLEQPLWWRRSLEHCTRSETATLRARFG